MSIDLRNFVQINLNYFLTKPLDRIRDTAVLLTCDETIDKNKIYSSFNTFKEDIISSNLIKYAKCFFNNKGLKLHLIGGFEHSLIILYYVWELNSVSGEYEWVIKQAAPTAGYLLQDKDYYSITSVDPAETNYYVYTEATHSWSAGSTTQPQEGNDVTENLANGLYYSVSEEPTTEELNNQKIEWLKSKVLELEYSEIVITTDQSLDILKEVQQDDAQEDIVPNAINNVNQVKTLSGYREKVYIGSTLDETVEFNPEKDWSNLVVKWGEAGIEMTTAAYLTQVNVTNPKTIADYCFTIEDISMFENNIVNNNSKLVALSEKNINVNTTLVNEIRNVWGNTISGYDLMNYYMRILLTQTLTERIVNVLASKIKYDKTGINKVLNSMIQELDIYKNNGYLSINDIWTEDDLYYNFNGVDYLVCKRNTPLTSGYKFVILPITALSEEQKKAHVFPPIYLLISDSISIRQIVISGDIY